MDQRDVPKRNCLVNSEAISLVCFGSLRERPPHRSVHPGIPHQIRIPFPISTALQNSRELAWGLSWFQPKSLPRQHHCDPDSRHFHPERRRLFAVDFFLLDWKQSFHRRYQYLFVEKSQYPNCLVPPHSNWSEQ